MGSEDSGLDSETLAALGLSGGPRDVSAGVQPTGGTSTPTVPASSSTFIRAEDGGTVSLGNEVVLTIPPGSMDQDRTITIERLDTLPSGYADEYQSYGQAYKFSPSGTQFDPGNPATVKIIYNAQQITTQGLDPDSLNLFYFDPDIDRYIASHSRVTNGELVATVEHFTDYMPGALPSLPGNVPPATPGLAALPSGQLRAGAPIMLRTRATDVNGVAGVQVFYRTYNGAPPATPFGSSNPNSAWMKRQPAVANNLNDPDAWYFVVPASATTPTPGWTIEYCFIAYDNQGTPSAPGGVPQGCVPVTRSINRFLDTTQAITVNGGTFAAGGKYHISARARDNTNNLFPIYPDGTDFQYSWDSSFSMGTLSFGSPGNQWSVMYEAVEQLNPSNPDVPVNSVGANLTVSLAPYPSMPVAPATFNVTPGSIVDLDILDPSDVVVNTGVHTAREGNTYQFDVRGEDSSGNKIAIVPQQYASGGGWSVLSDSSAGPAAPHPGSITNITGCPPTPCPPLSPSSSGLWDTLDVVGHVAIAVNFVGHSAFAVYNVLPRIFSNAAGSYYISSSPYHTANESGQPSMVLVGPTLYLTYNHQNHWDSPYTGTGVGYGYEMRDYRIDAAVGGPLPDAGSSDGVASHLNYAAWPQSSYMATDGTKPYIIFSDRNSSAVNGGANQIRIKGLTHPGGQWLNVPTSMPGTPSLNLNSSYDAQNPSMAFVGSDLWAAWSEKNAAGRWQIVVKCYCSGTWQLMATSLNVSSGRDADAPMVADAGGVPMVLWVEDNGAGNRQLYSRVYNGSWGTTQNLSINSTGTMNASPMSVAGSGNRLTIAWRENNANNQYIYVRRYSGGTSGTWSSFESPAAPLNSDFGFTSTSYKAPPIVALDGAGRPYVLITEGYSAGPFNTNTRLMHFNPLLGNWVDDGQINTSGKTVEGASMAIYGSKVYILHNEDNPSGTQNGNPGTNNAMSFKVYK
tara:strand:+ start:22079 stop:24970 length:2892 start_codon:yes stop_codon:yes gene_type:complete